MAKPNPGRSKESKQPFVAKGIVLRCGSTSNTPLNELRVREL